MQRHFGLLSLIGGVATGLCLGLVSRTAFARPFEDPVDAFHFEFAPVGAKTCVLQPLAASDQGTCEEHDFEALRNKVPVTDQAIVVTRGPRSYLLTYGRHPIVPGGDWVQGVIDDSHESHPGAKIVGKYPTLLTRRRVGMAEVMRVDLLVSESPGTDEPIEVISYLIPGRKAHHRLEVQAPSALAALARDET